MSQRNLTALALASAAAALFATVPAAVQAAEQGTVHCGGVTSCKGTSACKTADNACKGQNTCAGKGFLEMTKAECEAKKGTVL